jgi:hypothetical protein
MASGVSRRGSSSNNRYEDTVDATGDAYQIYSEVVNAGKNLQGGGFVQSPDKFMNTY